MKKVNICALKKDRKSVLETLQRLGLVEVSDLDKNSTDFKTIDTFNMRSKCFGNPREIPPRRKSLSQQYTGAK